MNFTQLLAYYKNLLIRQYNGLRKASETIGALVAPVLIPQNGGFVTDNEGDIVTDNEGWPITVLDPNAQPIIPLAIQQAFNIQTALMAQLIILGKYVGVVPTGQDFSGFVTLTQSQFQQLIAIASARNILRGTTFAINFFISAFFTGTLTVVDDLNMHMTYFYAAQFGSNIVAEFFIKAGLLPKPLAVGQSIVYTYPYVGEKFFGFAYDNQPAQSYISPISTDTVPLTGHVLIDSDFIYP